MYLCNQKIKILAGLIVYCFHTIRRDYLFPIHGPDKGTHFDMIYGFKFGWIIDLYKSNKTINNKYYFN